VLYSGSHIRQKVTLNGRKNPSIAMDAKQDDELEVGCKTWLGPDGVASFAIATSGVDPSLASE
jgi:hypothetical protein